MNRITEIEKARNEVIRARNKLKLLTKRNVSSRNEEYKYWKERHDVWIGYGTELSKLKKCNNHPSPEIEISKIIRADGGFHIQASCPGCRANLKANGQWVSHKNIPGELLTSLPTLDDYSTNNPSCVVCKARGTQLHHWAPKELFGEAEAERWPKASPASLGRIPYPM